MRGLRPLQFPFSVPILGCVNPPHLGHRRHVTDTLVDAGVLTEAQVQAGLVRQRETGRRIGETLVEMGFISEEDIAWYVGSGEPMGKAGAYGIQGRGARFIERIEGSWSNVVGLPVHAVHLLLARAGWQYS